MSADYTEDSIRSLDWKEHIRLRPGMYIGKLGDGSSPDDGIYVLIKEVIDNSIDEFVMGHGKVVEVSVSDKTGGAIVVWQDYRSGSRDIYAQRIYSGGDLTVSVEEENSNSFSNISANKIHKNGEYKKYKIITCRFYIINNKFINTKCGNHKSEIQPKFL